MRILLLGKDGQVGRELMRTMLPHGNITAVGRSELDLADADAIQNKLESEKPDIIINAAAYTNVDKAEEDISTTWAVNAVAVAQLADFAQKHNLLLVHYSTDYVFDGNKPSPYEIIDKPNPINVYGQSKLAGENAIRESGCRHLIFRTSWVYSLHGRNFLKTMLRLAKERDEISVVSDQEGTPTSAELIADVTSLAVAGYKYKILSEGLYHLTSAGKTTWYGFAAYILDTARAKGIKYNLDNKRLKPISSNEYSAVATRPHNSVLDSTLLSSKLKLHLPDWRVHVTSLIEKMIIQKLLS